jgi:uncharacterized protein YybS (DUF2232 family)
LRKGFYVLSALSELFLKPRQCMVFICNEDLCPFSFRRLVGTLWLRKAAVKFPVALDRLHWRLEDCFVICFLGWAFELVLVAENFTYQIGQLPHPRVQ